MKSSLHPDVTGHLRARLYLLEEGIVRWLARWSITVLRVGLAG